MKTKKKKILVTGGAGFIGSHLVDELIDRGHAILIIDDLSTGKLKNINRKAKFIKLNLGSTSAPKVLSLALREIDYVFHLAAIPRIQYCMEHPLKCHSSNVNGTLNLLNACAKNKQVKKFIQASSCMVYGSSDNLTVSEDAPIRPQTVYGVHKYIQELYVNTYAKLYGLPSVILRYFGVYGTRRHSENGAYPNVTAAFLKDKKEKNKIFIFGDGKQSRDMVHVFDIVRATTMAMESRFCNGEVFNIGTGKPNTINEIAEYYKCPIEHKEPRPNDARYLTSDTKKTKKLLNWEPKISFAEGIKCYLNDQS